ncbi:MAG: glycosyltransferase [Bacteroidota bacterium]
MDSKQRDERPPIISVVMSVYNGEEYLRESIESILNQTFKGFEFVIINDGSTDKSLEIIKSYSDARIIVINQKNSGLAIALNNGLKIAKGKYIARMDADDISIDTRLEVQLDFMENNNEYVIIGSNAIVIDKSGNYIYTTNLATTDNQLRKLLPSSPFMHPSVLMKKEAVEKCDYYYEAISKLYSFEDVILWNKLCKQGAIANMKKPLIKYRIQPFAATTKSGAKKVINEILNKIIERGFILENEIDILKKIKLQERRNDKFINYHLHLSKKYLWNNCQPKLARANIFKSMLYNPFSIEPFFLLFFSFMPKGAINFIYTKMKGS